LPCFLCLMLLLSAAGIVANRLFIRAGRCHFMRTH
jgi:hypothetical protein